MTTSLKFIPPVIAHRGASAYAPENTLSAFRKAHELNIKWVEFDVMPASCGTPMVFHDDLLERTTNSCGFFEEKSARELKKLDAGSWFSAAFKTEKIPTLIEVLSYLADKKMAANLEIKTLIHQEPTFIPHLLEVLANAKKPELILFSSFSFSALTLFRQYDKKSLLGILMHEWLEDWEEWCDSLNCISVHAFHEILTEDRIKLIKAKQKFLLSYTVNQVDRANELLHHGVDAVFSDLPDVIVQGLSSPL